jgi:hypothetical protein
MFASGKAPFGGGESYIEVDLTGTGSAASSGGGSSSPTTDRLSIHAVVVDDASGIALGPPGSPGTPYLELPLCCTTARYSAGQCGPGAQVGGLILFPNRTGPSVPAPAVASWVTSAAAGTGALPALVGTARFDVQREGTQSLLVVACDARGSFGLPPFTVSLTVAFRNPYGFLPGIIYGDLPFYGVLFVAYLLGVVLYSALCCKNREHLLALQAAVLGLLVLGAVEMAVWFFTFNSKNETGVPTPCNVCPTTSDYMAAVVLSVLKTTVSRALLLAVSLGYGVVHAALSRRTTIYLAALSLTYFLFAALNQVEKETTYSVQATAWEAPVFVLDMTFFVWTYRSLLDIEAALAAQGQNEKLRMYRSLIRVIKVNGLAWMLITLSIILIIFGVLPLSWKALFFLQEFWAVIYFAVLVAVAVIWAPGPTAFRYSLYSQPATDEAGAAAGPGGPDDDEEDGAAGAGGDGKGAAAGPAVRADGVEIEMTGGASTAARTSGGSSGSSSSSSAKKAAGAPVGAEKTFVIEEEDEGDDEADEGDTARLPASAGQGKVDMRPMKTNGHSV